MAREVSARRLFQDGHYIELINELEERLKTCADGLDTSLLLKNNVVVCRLMLAGSFGCKSTLLPELDSILLTCCSIPAKESILYTELVVLYNSLYANVMCDGTVSGEETRHGRLYQTVNRTLYRLYRLLALDGRDMKDLTILSPRDCCLHLIDKCLSILMYKFGAMPRIALALCCCVNMVCMMNARDRQNMAWCTEKVQSVLNNMLKMGTAVNGQLEEGLMLPVQADHRTLVTSAQTLMEMGAYQRAVGKFQAGLWADCHHCLQAMPQAADSKIVASFLSGWSLYSNDQCLEGVALLMETLRAQQPLTQRLKARIYNLIGMCFSKLDKVQLAIQMYKEALSADFGFLLPLYKVSQQYRKQGQSDMELECLNLLVTAIEMREPSVATVAGLDLLDMVELEDNDVPYPRAVYLMASRALALQRYDAAAEKYTELISHLKSWQADGQAFKSIPSLEQIYQESVQSLLKSDRLTECVSMCDTVLSATCCHGDLSNTTLANDSSFMRSSFDQSVLLKNNTTDSCEIRSFLDETSQVSVGSRKRKCGDSQGPWEEAPTGSAQAEAVTLKIKAEALVKLKDQAGALTCLERAVEAISKHRQVLLQKHLQTDDQPAHKRRRLDTSCVHDMKNTETLELECDIYTLTADILASQQHQREAQHYRRLVSQLTAVASKMKET